MTEDALSNLRIQNAKDAYIALFNALGPGHYATQKAAYDYARILNDEAEDRSEEAYEYIKGAYEALRKRQGELDVPLIDIGEEYFYTLVETGREEEYLSVYDRVIADCGGEERIRNENFETWHSCQHDLAHIYKERGEMEKAIALLRNALRRTEEEYGFAERDTISTIMHLLTLIRLHYGEREEECQADKEIERFSNRWRNSQEEPEIRPIIISFLKAAFSEKNLTPQALAKTERQLMQLDEYSQAVISPIIEYIVTLIGSPDELLD